MGMYQYISALRTEKLVFLPSLKENWMINFCPSWYSLFCKQITISSGFIIIYTAFTLKKFEFLHEDYRDIMHLMEEYPDQFQSSLYTWYYLMVGLFCFFCFSNILYFLEYVVLKVLESNYQLEYDKIQKSQLKQSQDEQKNNNLNSQINNNNMLNSNLNNIPKQSMSVRYDMKVIKENDDDEAKIQKNIKNNNINNQKPPTMSQIQQNQEEEEEKQDDLEDEGNDIPNDNMHSINNIIISPRSPQALLQTRSTTPINGNNNNKNDSQGKPKFFKSTNNNNKLQSQIQKEKEIFKKQQEQYYEKQQEHFRKNQEFLQKQKEIILKNQQKQQQQKNQNETANQSSSFECQSQKFNQQQNKQKSESTSDFECQSNKIINNNILQNNINNNNQKNQDEVKSSSFECMSQEIPKDNFQQNQNQDNDNINNNNNNIEFQGKLMLSSDLMFTSHQNEFYVDGQQVRELNDTYALPQMSAKNSTKRNIQSNIQQQYINSFL